ncbi:MAG: hypothetical protein AAGC71_05550 [Pseudomonadota bacterium]
MLSRSFAVIVGVTLVTGCATYTTPGGGFVVGGNAKNGAAKGDASIATIMAREPAAAFPARIAIVRAQAPDYSAYNSGCYGRGYYCVITARDVESESDFEQLGRLPMIAAVAPMNRMVIGHELNDVGDLRRAAAELRADMLLLYSFDTRVHVDAKDLGPLQTVSLGFLRNRQAHVDTTASLALYDVRTGFLYGLAEATAREDQRASVWSTQSVIDKARRSAEQRSFSDLISEFGLLWKGVVETHVAQPVAATVN